MRVLAGCLVASDLEECPVAAAAEELARSTSRQEGKAEEEGSTLVIQETSGKTSSVQVEWAEWVVQIWMKYSNRSGVEVSAEEADLVIAVALVAEPVKDITAMPELLHQRSLLSRKPYL